MCFSSFSQIVFYFLRFIFISPRTESSSINIHMSCSIVFTVAGSEISFQGLLRLMLLSSSHIMKLFWTLNCLIFLIFLLTYNKLYNINCWGSHTDTGLFLVWSLFRRWLWTHVFGQFFNAYNLNVMLRNVLWSLWKTAGLLFINEVITNGHFLGLRPPHISFNIQPTIWMNFLPYLNLFTHMRVFHWS